MDWAFRKLLLRHGLGPEAKDKQEPVFSRAGTVYGVAGSRMGGYTGGSGQMCSECSGIEKKQVETSRPVLQSSTRLLLTGILTSDPSPPCPFLPLCHCCPAPPRRASPQIHQPVVIITPPTFPLWGWTPALTIITCPSLPENNPSVQQRKQVLSGSSLFGLHFLIVRRVCLPESVDF